MADQLRLPPRARGRQQIAFPVGFWKTIRRRHVQADIEAAGAPYARLMFAVLVNVAGYDLKHIGKYLGRPAPHHGSACEHGSGRSRADVAKVIWTVQQLLGHVPLGTPVSIRMSMKRRLRRCSSEHYDGTQ